MLTIEQEWAAEDDGGPKTPPPPPDVICPACDCRAPQFWAMRHGHTHARLTAHGPGYPAATCDRSWQPTPPEARPAGLGNPPRNHPAPASLDRQRAEVAALPLFGGA
jgi:hypothetical protein